MALEFIVNLLKVSSDLESKECNKCCPSNVKDNPAQVMLRDGWVENCDLFGVTPDVDFEGATYLPIEDGNPS